MLNVESRLEYLESAQKACDVNILLRNREGKFAQFIEVVMQSSAGTYFVYIVGMPWTSIALKFSYSSRCYAITLSVMSITLNFTIIVVSFYILLGSIRPWMVGIVVGEICYASFWVSDAWYSRSYKSVHSLLMMYGIPASILAGRTVSLPSQFIFNFGILQAIFAGILFTYIADWIVNPNVTLECEPVELNITKLCMVTELFDSGYCCHARTVTWDIVPVLVLIGGTVQALRSLMKDILLSSLAGIYKKAESKKPECSDEGKFEIKDADGGD